MKRTWVALAAVSPLLLASATSAQAPAGNVGQIFVNKVKSGTQEQYERARKRHMEWHKKKGDNWEWLTWEIVTGDRNGQYIVGSFNHSFKDFDGREQFEAEDAADAAANMGPFEESSVQSLYLFRADLSMPPSGPGPAKFSQITHFYLKPEGVTDFTEAVKKVAEAAKKTNYPIHPLWYQLFNGGEGPAFVLVSPRNTWAEFQPPDKTLDAMVEEALGKVPGAAALSSLRKAVHYTYSETAHFRPDLSYRQEGK
jgi:hypothetical protein